MAKNGSDLHNFYSKQNFWNLLVKNIFFLFLTDYKLLMFHNNNVKISGILNNWNLLKTRIHQLPILLIFAYFAAF